MSARQRMPRGKSALGALTAAEKGGLLDELLMARPELREQVEALARGRLVDEDRSAVADDVKSALCFHDIDELNGRAGYHPGWGYVDVGEAADEILDEALQPFLDDLVRRTELGMRAAAVELAVGILGGLYAYREAGSESLLEYSPDYPVERAADVVDRCAKLGVELPVDDLLERVPEWSRLLFSTRPPPGGTGGGRQPGARVGPGTESRQVSSASIGYSPTVIFPDRWSWITASVSGRCRRASLASCHVWPGNRSSCGYQPLRPSFSHRCA